MLKGVSKAWVVASVFACLSGPAWAQWDKNGVDPYVQERKLKEMQDLQYAGQQPSYNTDQQKLYELDRQKQMEEEAWRAKQQNDPSKGNYPGNEPSNDPVQQPQINIPGMLRQLLNPPPQQQPVINPGNAQPVAPQITPGSQTAYSNTTVDLQRHVDDLERRMQRIYGWANLLQMNTPVINNEPYNPRTDRPQAINDDTGNAAVDLKRLTMYHTTGYAGRGGKMFIVGSAVVRAPNVDSYTRHTPGSPDETVYRDVTLNLGLELVVTNDAGEQISQATLPLSVSYQQLRLQANAFPMTLPHTVRLPNIPVPANGPIRAMPLHITMRITRSTEGSPNDRTVALEVIPKELTAIIIYDPLNGENF